eukprot:3865141-Prymnesium_polylepis.1
MCELIEALTGATAPCSATPMTPVALRPWMHVAGVCGSAGGCGGGGGGLGGGSVKGGGGGKPGHIV